MNTATGAQGATILTGVSQRGRMTSHQRRRDRAEIERVARGGKRPGDVVRPSHDVRRHDVPQHAGKLGAVELDTTVEEQIGQKRLFTPCGLLLQRADLEQSHGAVQDLVPVDLAIAQYRAIDECDSRDTVQLDPEVGGIDVDEAIGNLVPAVVGSDRHQIWAGVEVDGQRPDFVPLDVEPRELVVPQTPEAGRVRPTQVLRVARLQDVSGVRAWRQDDEFLAELPLEGLHGIEQLAAVGTGSVRDIPADREDVTIEQAVVVRLLDADNGQRPGARPAPQKFFVIGRERPVLALDEHLVQRGLIGGGDSVGAGRHPLPDQTAPSRVPDSRRVITEFHVEANAVLPGLPCENKAPKEHFEKVAFCFCQRTNRIGDAEIHRPRSSYRATAVEQPR